MLDTLHILHLKFTGIEKTDLVCAKRYESLIEELRCQGITDFKIWEGFYEPDNTKQAIQKGHKKIISYAKENNLPRIIVSEDDIVFSSPKSYEYFISQIPEDYQLFCGLIYNGEVSDGRILNGMSGTHTLLCVHESMYDFILSQPDDVHCDRHLGQYAYQFKYFVCEPMICYQRGGYSHNLRYEMFYHTYLEGKKLYDG